MIAGHTAHMTTQHAIPVIIDTDIGGDIDDTWALAMALKRPELDLRLITTCTGDTIYRAKIVCRLLELAGRSDIPVGIGERYPSDGPREKQLPWVADYRLDQYPGALHDDGIDALIRTCMDTPDLTLIGIGPMTNIEAAVRREPRIAARTRLVLMAGCVHKHYRDWQAPGPFPEFNVVQDLPAARVALAAPWREVVITPLDTCERIRLTGAHYQRCVASRDPLLQAVITNYRLWLKRPAGGEEVSSILYDAVAIWLAFSQQHLVMERHGLGLTQDGVTRLDPTKPMVNLALEWSDLDAWIEEFVATMESPALAKPPARG